MQIFNDPHMFGRVPNPDCEEFCHDAAKNETLCDTCEYYEIDKFGCPSCCGNEYQERGNDEMEVIAKINNIPENARNKSGFVVAKVIEGEFWFWGIYDDEQTANMAVEDLCKYGEAVVLERKI